MICLCLELTSTVQFWGNKSTHPSNMWQLSSILFIISQLIRKNSLSDVIISHLRLNTSGGFDKTWQPEFPGLKTGVMVFLRKFSQIRVEKHVRHFQPQTPLTWDPLPAVSQIILHQESPLEDVIFCDLTPSKYKGNFGESLGLCTSRNGGLSRFTLTTL